MVQRFTRRAPARPRRPMDWEYAQVTIGAAAAAARAAAQVVSTTELNAQYTDPTLMASRLIGMINFAAGSGNSAMVVVGLIAWDDINDTVPPLAELPGPISNGNLDWIIRQAYFGLPGVASMASIAPGDETVTSRARRKLGSSRSILLVQENGSTAVTTSSIFDVRCLIKE